MNAATRIFIEKHLKDDVRQLALQKFPDDVDKMLVLNQIEARQLLSKKVPSWASNPDLLFPRNIARWRDVSETANRDSKPTTALSSTEVVAPLSD